MPGFLDSKVAIITGGARGIGRAICDRYAAEGARVVVADINAAEAEKVATVLGNGAIGVGVDLTMQEGIDILMASTLEAFGQLDILVNCAGIFEMQNIPDITRASFARSFAVNVEALLFATQAASNQMLKQGTGGRIINFASQAGRRGEAGVAVYCATKAAVVSITQSTGLELVRQGINVNAIAPGQIDTPMWDVVDAGFAQRLGVPVGETKKRAALAVPMGRMGTPQEVAALAAYLAGPDSSYIACQTFNVDGGNYTN